MVAYKTIVVGTDFSTLAEQAVEAAVRLIRGEQEAKLVLVHVLDVTQLWGGGLPYDLAGDVIDEQIEDTVRESQGRLQSIADDFPEVPVKVVVEKGWPARTLVDIAHRESADLIVVATQGFGAIQRAILGSVTTSVLGLAHCPVLVVGEGRSELRDLKTIVAAVDLSQGSVAVLENATAMSRDEHSSIHVISVFEKPFLIAGEQTFGAHDGGLPLHVRRLEDHRGALASLVAVHGEDGVDYKVSAIPGSPPYPEILAYIRREEADLIVVGRSGHRTLSKALFGTNAARIAAGSQVPVLVVPPAGVSPLETDGIEASQSEALVFASIEPESLSRLMMSLVDANVEPQHIMVLSGEASSETEFSKARADEGFVAGCAVGTSIGGVLGGLASLTAPTPIGLVVAGPAVVFGLVGGILGTLAGHSVPNKDIDQLQHAVDTGKIVVAVRTQSEEAFIRVKTAFADAGAHPQRIQRGQYSRNRLS